MKEQLKKNDKFLLVQNANGRYVIASNDILSLADIEQLLLSRKEDIVIITGRGGNIRDIVYDSAEIEEELYKMLYKKYGISNNVEVINYIDLNSERIKELMSIPKDIFLGWSYSSYSSFVWEVSEKMDKRKELADRLIENWLIFRKYGTIEKFVITVTAVQQENYSKWGKELLSQNKIDYLMEMRCLEAQHILFSPLKEYSYHEWMLCLREGILLDYAIPVFANVLNNYPMLAGTAIREWRTLYDITKIDENFWNEHSDWKVFFTTLIKEKVIKNNINSLREEYLEQLLLFVN
ncbi:MAG: hypothetical protein E7294_10805 [Lachnospiraceae bacterium]|nr:hypothetical protein [Lachnospiraceae bacterium]